MTTTYTKFLLLTLLGLFPMLASCGQKNQTTYDIEGSEINGFTTNPTETTTEETAKPTILFLHGAAYTAATWKELGITDELAQRGIRSVAIDLPGYGASPTTEKTNTEFLRNLIKQTDQGHGVVVVSPSMSGSYSLALIAQDTSDSMKGFIAVAPVGIDTFAEANPNPIKLATLAIWGEEDTVIPVEKSALLLAQFTNATFELIPRAGHAAYQQEPIKFVDAIEQFVNRLPAE